MRVDTKHHVNIRTDEVFYSVSVILPRNTIDRLRGMPTAHLSEGDSLARLRQVIQWLSMLEVMESNARVATSVVKPRIRDALKDVKRTYRFRGDRDINLGDSSED